MRALEISANVPFSFRSATNILGGHGLLGVNAWDTCECEVLSLASPKKIAGSPFEIAVIFNRTTAIFFFF